MLGQKQEINISDDSKVGSRWIRRYTRSTFEKHNWHCGTQPLKKRSRSHQARLIGNKSVAARYHDFVGQVERIAESH